MEHLTDINDRELVPPPAFELANPEASQELKEILSRLKETPIDHPDYTKLVLQQAKLRLQNGKVRN